MAKNDQKEELKKKCNAVIDDSIETVKAVGQIAGEKIDVYMQKAKKHLGEFAKKTSEKLSVEKDKVAKRKEVIHKEREEEKILKNIDDAEELMRQSHEAAEKAHVKYLEALAALNKETDEEQKEENK